MKSLGVCYWSVKMPRCECEEHGLEYITFYVQKHIAHLAVCSWPQLVCDGPLGAAAFVKTSLSRIVKHCNREHSWTIWWIVASVCFVLVTDILTIHEIVSCIDLTQHQRPNRYYLLKSLVTWKLYSCVRLMDCVLISCIQLISKSAPEPNPPQTLSTLHSLDLRIYHIEASMMDTCVTSAHRVKQSSICVCLWILPIPPSVNMALFPQSRSHGAS